MQRDTTEVQGAGYSKKMSNLLLQKRAMRLCWVLPLRVKSGTEGCGSWGQLICEWRVELRRRFELEAMSKVLQPEE